MKTEHDAPACALCERVTRLHFHHLIPRKVHRRTRFRKHYTRDELNQGVYLCRQCHSAVHRTYDEMTLAQSFNTLALLQGSPEIARHVAWVRKQRVVRSG